MGSFGLSVASLVAALFACNLSSGQIILEVPGYAVLNGTEELSSYTERPFFAFRSVFYAEKPTSEGRFLPPLPKQPFSMDEVQQATANNRGCPRLSSMGEEDCLSMNIFTPKLPSEPNSTDSLLPVMFWIHGGGFSIGHPLEYLPNRYMEHDIVLVVIQYRLGPLGFLSLDSDEAPGNAGIFDQIEALRWVNKHIANFGGDPSRVTIAGESAGSASVTLLLLAPQARGLFCAAIGESGSILAGWALDRDGRGKAASLRVAELAGCPLEPYESLLECVRTVDANELSEAFRAYAAEDISNGGLGSSGSSPVIQIAGKERIIERDPRELFASGNYTTDVPVMFGANKHEGVLFLGTMYNTYLKPNNLTENGTFLANDFVPLILNALHIEDETGELAANLTEKYLAGAELGNFTSMTPGLTDLCSVLFMKAPTYEMMQYHSDHNPDSYFYSFNFEGRNSLFIYEFARDPPPIPHGVNHADELIYLFIYPFPSIPPGLNFTEERLSKRMLQVWTNIVKHGKPTPEGVELLSGVPQFLPYSRTKENFMTIDGEWTVSLDYTQTYTITTDELNQANGHLRSKEFMARS